MSPEELDEARADQAWKEWVDGARFGGTRAFAAIAARLAREGWTPPEPVPVDPDVLAFREWIMEQEPEMRERSYEYDADFWDNCLSAKAYLAGARMACEQERERAKVLEEYVEAYALRFGGVARSTLAKYHGEA